MNVVRLYPRAWRERYGEELLDLIDQLRTNGSGPRRRDSLDLITGAVLEWIRVGVKRIRTLAIGATAVSLVVIGISAFLQSTDTTAATVVTTTTTNTHSPGGGSPYCKDSQVSVRDLGGQTTAQHVNQVILFTNVSRRSCTLEGYPAVFALDRDGQAKIRAMPRASVDFGRPQRHESAPSSVSLAPNQVASALVQSTDTSGPCTPYPLLLVTPPDLNERVVVHVAGTRRKSPGLSACSTIEVQPIVPGTSGRS
jgi:Protein of unknown function (DUF4232)